MNLETLELTINGTAEGATGGIDTLSAHIAALGTVLSNALNSLKEFNGQLSQMKTISASIRMPDIGKMTGASGASSSKKNGLALSQEQAMAMLNVGKTALAYQNAKEKAMSFFENAQSGKYTSKQLTEQAIQTQNATSRYEKLAEAERNAADEAKRIAEETAQANTPLGKFKQGFANIKEGFGNLTKGFTGFFSKVKRIATSMLIRSAIRGLIKSLKEGVNNLYEWSKLNNGEFAASMDKLKAKSLQLKNSIGASIAPVIQAAIPVINSLMNAAINAFNWVNQLISLLTGKSTWTKATENADAYADAAGKAGGAAKEWLAAFDELNVMNNSGGGGGGGSSTDYSNMFEESAFFNEQIREIADFLKNNFESLKAMAVAIGVAILAWKISDAFAATLPALSKIAGLVGIGAVIAITLQADWMLTNQYLNTGNDGWLIAEVLTTAVGATAAAVMAKKLIGGQAAMWAASITLAFSAITSITANIQNTRVDALSATSIKQTIIDALKAGAAVGIAVKAMGGTIGWALVAAAGAALLTFAVVIALKASLQKTNLEWGNIDLTDEDVQKFVNTRLFSVDVPTVCNVIADKVEFSDAEQAKVKTELISVMGTWKIIQLGVADDQDYATLKTQVDGLIVTVEGWITTARETGRLTLQFTPSLGGSTSDEQGDWFTNYDAGWDIVEKFVKDKGAEIGTWLTDEEKRKIAESKPEILQELMQQLADVTSAIAGADAKYDALGKFRAGLGDLTKASFSEVLKSFDQYKKDLTENYTKLVNDQITKQGQLVEALFAIDPNSDEYKKAKADLDRMVKDMDKTIKESVDEATADGEGLILQWIYGHHGEGSIDNVSSWILKDLKRSISPEALSKGLKNILVEAGVQKEEFEAMELIGFSGWDLLTENVKQQFIQSLHITKDNFKIAVKNLGAMGVKADEIVKFVDWDKLTDVGKEEFVQAMKDTYGASGIASIKSKFPDIKITDIIKTTDWDTFTRKERLEYLASISEAFGSSAAMEEARNAGLNIAELVQDGMKSKDEKIRKQAEEWSKIIKGGVESETPVVAPELNETAANNVANSLKSIIEAKPATMSKISAAFMPGYPQNLSDQINKMSATINTTPGLGGDAQTKIQNALNALGVFKITVQASVEGLGNSLREKFKAALSGIEINLGGNLIGKITAKAMGGLVTSGDLFIANENGVPEMVGRFGNQTAVANTDQIVNGISKGVAEANSQQNALLAEQNNLLRAILQKDGSVRLEASAALGRVARQSLNMYGAMTGV